MFNNFNSYVTYYQRILCLTFFWEQIQGMRWVKDNIQAFGGDQVGMWCEPVVSVQAFSGHTFCKWWGEVYPLVN